MKKKIPKFENEDEEREFWAAHDSTNYVDWGKAKRIRFPRLKSSTKTKSEIATEALEDAEDLAAFEERTAERNLDFENVVKDLKQRGKI